jgi:flagellar hook-length control protein FliK
MNASPLPKAEFLPTPPGAPGAGIDVGELADPRAAIDPAVNPRGAADFAALLLSAGLAAEAPVEDAGPQHEASSERAPAPEVSGSAIDGLLFLAAVQATTVASATVATSGPQAGSQSEDAVAGSLAPARVPPVDFRAPDAAAVARALVPTDLTPTDPSEAAIGAALDAAPERSLLEAFAPNANATADAPSGRAQGRLEPKPDSIPAFLTAPAAEANKAPVLETVASEAKPVASTSSAEPMSSLGSSTSAAPPAPAVVEIDTPVHDPAWRTEVAGRIASLVTRGVEHAELRVTPPELGPIEMRIDLRGGEATLAIIATQATTRDALEQALPLLRDMLAQQGLSLGQASVQDGRADHQATGGNAASRTDLFGDAEATDANALDAPRPALVRRLIDVFA